MNDGQNHTRCSHSTTTEKGGVRRCGVCLYNLTDRKSIEQEESELVEKIASEKAEARERTACAVDEIKAVTLKKGEKNEAINTGEFKLCDACAFVANAYTGKLAALCDSCTKNKAAIQELLDKNKVLEEDCTEFQRLFKQKHAINLDLLSRLELAERKGESEIPGKTKGDTMFDETPEGGSRIMYLYISILKDRIRKAEPRVRELETRVSSFRREVERVVKELELPVPNYSDAVARASRILLRSLKVDLKAEQSPLTAQLDSISDEICTRWAKNFLLKMKTKEESEADLKAGTSGLCHVTCSDCGIDWKNVSWAEGEEHRRNCPERPSAQSSHPLLTQTDTWKTYGDEAPKALRKVWVDVNTPRDFPHIAILDRRRRGNYRKSWVIFLLTGAPHVVKAENHHRWQYIEAPDLS